MTKVAAVLAGLVIGAGLSIARAEEPAVMAGGAEPPVRTLGWGRLMDNDIFGDGEDRWQSAAYNVSVLRGRDWQGSLPAAPFEIMEYRFGVGIVAPWDLEAPWPDDRRYAGRLEFAANTYFETAGLETQLGLGLVAIGPATGVSDLHEGVHDLIDAPDPAAAAAQQLGNHLYPVLTAEIGRGLDLGRAELRPFAAVRAGDESLWRAGFDLSFGARETGALWLRDTVTGQRYTGIAGQGGGTAFTLGADIAHVFDSAYFPGSDAIAFKQTRGRVRAGVKTWLGPVGVFYGATWLSEEFEGQYESQVVGSLRIDLKF